MRSAERVEEWERGEVIQEIVREPEVYRSLRRIWRGKRMEIKVNRSLGRRWCKCKCKCKIDLQVIVWE